MSACARYLDDRVNKRLDLSLGMSTMCSEQMYVQGRCQCRATPDMYMGEHGKQPPRKGCEILGEGDCPSEVLGL